MALAGGLFVFSQWKQSLRGSAFMYKKYCIPWEINLLGRMSVREKKKKWNSTKSLKLQ